MDEQEAHNATSNAHTNRRPIPCISATIHHISQLVKHVVVIRRATAFEKSSSTEEVLLWADITVHTYQKS